MENILSHSDNIEQFHEERKQDKLDDIQSHENILWLPDKHCFAVVPSISFVNMRFNIASLYVIVYLMVELPKISTLFPWKDMKDQSICLEIIT